jgi:hypothetical protein
MIVPPAADPGCRSGAEPQSALGQWHRRIMLCCTPILTQQDFNSLLQGHYRDVDLLWTTVRRCFSAIGSACRDFRIGLEVHNVATRILARACPQSFSLDISTYDRYTVGYAMPKPVPATDNKSTKKPGTAGQLRGGTDRPRGCAL